MTVLFWVVLLKKVQSWSVYIWMSWVYIANISVCVHTCQKLVTWSCGPCFLPLGEAYIFGTEMVPWVTTSLSRSRNSKLYGKQRLFACTASYCFSHYQGSAPTMHLCPLGGHIPWALFVVVFLLLLLFWKMFKECISLAESSWQISWEEML